MDICLGDAMQKGLARELKYYVNFATFRRIERLTEIKP